MTDRAGGPPAVQFGTADVNHFRPLSFVAVIDRAQSRPVILQIELQIYRHLLALARLNILGAATGAAVRQSRGPRQTT